MRITLLGTGSTLPSSTRLQTGAIVERGGDTLLVDCGSGITHRLAQSAIDYREVDIVLLTHTPRSRRRSPDPRQGPLTRLA